MMFSSLRKIIYFMSEIINCNEMDKAILYLYSQITYAICSFDWDIISGCFYEDSSEIFFLINIIDSPSSTCGAIESTIHFYYIVIKIVRLDNNLYFHYSLLSLTWHILLFSSNIFLSDENMILLANVQSFLLQSRRFERFVLCRYA
jgi:hypothetical protein